MKHTFWVKNSSSQYSYLHKKKTHTSAPQLLHCAHISSIARNICQVISVVKGVNNCRTMLCRTVQQAGEGKKENLQSLLFTFKLDCWTDSDQQIQLEGLDLAVRLFLCLILYHNKTRSLYTEHEQNTDLQSLHSDCSKAALTFWGW